MTASHWKFLTSVVLFLNILVWGCALLIIFNRF